MKKKYAGPTVYIKLPKHHHLYLIQMAAARGCSMQAMMAMIVADFAGGVRGPQVEALFDAHAKKPLPPIIRDGHRPTIQFVRWTSEFCVPLNCYIPLEWHRYFEKLSAETGRSTARLINNKLAQYLTDDEINARAVAKDIPTNAERRELMMHVFPDLPLCDFSNTRSGSSRRRKQVA